MATNMENAEAMTPKQKRGTTATDDTGELMESLPTPVADNTANGLTYDRPGEPAKEERLAALRKYPHPSKRTELSQLPTWVRLALMRRVLHGATWKQVAEDAGKNWRNLRAYGSSPAAKAFVASLEQVARENPEAVGQMVLRGQSGQIAVDALLLYEALMRSKNLPEAAKQNRALLEVAIKKPQDAPPTAVIINLTEAQAAAFLEMQMGDSTYSKVGVVKDAEVVDG